MTITGRFQPGKHNLFTDNDLHLVIEPSIYSQIDTLPPPYAFLNVSYDFVGQANSARDRYMESRTNLLGCPRDNRQQGRRHVVEEEDIGPSTANIDCSVVATENQPWRCPCLSSVQVPSRTNKFWHCTTSDAIHLSRQTHLPEGAGMWLLKNNTFCKWREVNTSSLLWLRGSPGCGKSMLTSAVAKILEKSQRSGDIITYFFCDRRLKATEAVLGILSTMVHDCLSRNMDAESQDRLLTLSYFLDNTGSQLSNSELKSFLKTFRHVLRPHETLFLILDGFDEIPDCQSGRELIRSLLGSSNSSDTRHRIKIFISSRSDCRPCLELGVALQIDMDKESSVQDDLVAFIHAGVQSLRRLNSYQHSDKLTEMLLSNSQRTFLWAGLVLRNLFYGSATMLSSTDVANISTARDIKASYGQMLRRIPDEVQHASSTLLGWVLYSTRPLSLDELRFALGTDSKLTEHDIWRISGGLLNTDKSQTVSFVHHSAKEYLLSVPNGNNILAKKPKQVHEMITRTCLKALSSTQLLQSVNLPVCRGSRMRLLHTQQSSRFAYAYNWIFHYILAEPHSQSLPGFLHSLLRRSLESEDIKTFENFMSNMPESQPKTSQTCRSTLADCFISRMILISASSLGLEPLARLELQMGGNSHLSCHRKGYEAFQPLHCAARGGYTYLAKVLLDYGADPYSKSSSGCTPMYYAVAHGHHEIVKLLMAQRSHSFSTSFNNIEPTLAPASTGYTTESFYFVATVSGICTHCTDMRAYYVISKHSQGCQVDNDWEPIHITGEWISQSDFALYSPLWSTSTHEILTGAHSRDRRSIIKWFSGEDMYQALRKAARGGMENIRNLLLAVGNDVVLINELPLLSQRISNLEICNPEIEDK